ncbi:hypothetical protein BDV27DRAFT_156306 [Aspergillus caelatus]|uniref:Uncharacterized protein n=1 Tax=Aspergillus caelatus TaxID=61420 RepID=A0A5N7A820_9EURO|nr:uncharacterized protein BDV27DRAFT_156306 [Aspergillus caelatus]KAE8366007.1 hypothetical protein BDV27DRAFT_156306 [Aspergillus caelatus]
MVQMARVNLAVIMDLTDFQNVFTRVAPYIPPKFEELSSGDAEFQRYLNVGEGLMIQKEDGGPEFASNDPLDIEHLDMAWGLQLRPSGLRTHVTTK